MSKPRLVYLGTPDFAVRPLAALVSSGAYHVLAVITQPDKPAGRGQRLAASPVKLFAEERAIPVFQPGSIKKLELSQEEDGTARLTGPEELSALRSFLNAHAPIDLFVTVAYGKIIPMSLAAIAAHGILNIHPSLLPRHRGAAPIQHTIFAGDEVTGVCLMQIDEGLDTGPVYLCEPLAVLPEDTAGTLAERLVEVGAKLLLDSIPKILTGSLVPQRQGLEGATYANKWEVEDCQLHWEEDALTCVRRIRASAPQPGARTLYQGEPIKVLKAHLETALGPLTLPPGAIAHIDRSSLVICAGDGHGVVIDELQFPGKRSLPIADVLRGRRFELGQRLGL